MVLSQTLDENQGSLNPYARAVLDVQGPSDGDSMAKPLKNLLLDRDGTVIKEKHYLSDPDEVELLPGVAQALAAVVVRGVRVFIVSNQSGIGRGYFKESACKAVNEKLRLLLAEHGVDIIDNVYCVHRPDADCLCRKPKTGLWDRLVCDHNLDPDESIMVGDKMSDAMFAKNCTMATSVLVLTGHGADQARKAGLHLYKHEGPCRFFPPSSDVPDILARDLPTALHYLKDRFI